MPSLVEIGRAGCLALCQACCGSGGTQGLPVLTIQGFGVVMCLTHGSHSADKAEVWQGIEESEGSSKRLKREEAGLRPRAGTRTGRAYRGL